MGPWKNCIKWHEMGPESSFSRQSRPCKHFVRHGFGFCEFAFLLFVWIPKFWISRFPDLQTLVQAWLGHEPWAGAALGGKKVLFPANPDLAGIFGRTDLDFVDFHFWDLFGFQISGFPGSQISKIWPLAGLGPGQAWAIWTNKCWLSSVNIGVWARNALFRVGETRASVTKYCFFLIKMKDDCPGNLSRLLYHHC